MFNSVLRNSRSNDLFWETFPNAPQNICHCCVTATEIVEGEYGNNPVGNFMQ